MGRPYAEELADLGATYDWALSANVERLARSVAALRGRPLIVVGSGGSQSTCHFAARLHEKHARLPARVLTPLEFIQHPVPQAAGVLLLSASGGNPDILAAAVHAINAEYAPVVSLSTRPETPLKTALMAHRHATILEYVGPSAKDGFLATNSLLLSTVLLSRGYGVVMPPELPALGRAHWPLDSQSTTELDEGEKALASEPISPALVAQTLSRPIVVALADGWATPAAYDLESKWGEIGFGAVTVTDARNFAHGRHYGLSRQIQHTLVLGISTQDEAGVLKRTLEHLPRDAYTAMLRTSLAGEAGAIDLIVRVLHITGAVGRHLGIDPGRPRVPAFGRALYHAGIPRRLIAGQGPRIVRKRAAPLDGAEDLWIRRKVSAAAWQGASEDTRELWRARCRAWVEAAASVRIGGVVFDYDGTLCEADERFGSPAVAVGQVITQLIEDGLRIGVATGRGDSVLDALRAVMPEHVWPQVLVGMYSGGLLCRLDDQPGVPDDRTDEIRLAQGILEASATLCGIARLRVRPAQLTIHADRPLPEGLLHRLVLEALASTEHGLSVNVFTSGHTVDVLGHRVSKVRVVEAVRSELLGLPRNAMPASRDGAPGSKEDVLRVMTIGDQGQANGNDWPFLDHLLGVSVEHVSSVFDACWNVAPPGARRTAALLGYLDALRAAPSGGFTWSVGRASRPVVLPRLTRKPKILGRSGRG